MEPRRSSLSQDAAREHIEAHFAYFQNASGAMRVRLDVAWFSEFPTRPGVYVVFEHERLIYAGETGSLRARMKDLRDSRNHTLRRQLGASLFAGHPDYRPATSKQKFPPAIETLLSRHIEENLSVKALPVIIGRKEIEELLVERERPKYNLRSRRGDAP